MPLDNPFSQYLSSLYAPSVFSNDPLMQRYGSDAGSSAIPTFGMDPIAKRQLQIQGASVPVNHDPVLSWYNAHPTTVNSPLGEGGSGTQSGGINYSSELGTGSSPVYQWRDQIDKASQMTGTPAQVIAAIMSVESGGNNPSGANVAGAVGLMQVLPQYHAQRAEKYGYSVTDPQGNILAGADFLKQLHDKAMSTYGGIDEQKAWNIAAAAYLGAWNWNSGDYSGAKDAFGTSGPDYVTRFDKALSQFGGLPSGTSASTLGTASSGSAPGNLQKAIDVASQFKGQPYVWGGANPNQGFDCSGLVQYSFKQAGVNLPRTAQEQYNATQRIDISQAKAGDLIFFTQTYDAGVPVSHVGIYLGNGMMLDSQTNGIVIESINSPYWQQHFYGFGRVSS